jgi:hypothetical protein
LTFRRIGGTIKYRGLCRPDYNQRREAQEEIVKKTAIYKTIDGYDVITAIVEAVSKPAETMEAVKLRVEALPETAQMKAITLKILAQQEVMREENAKAVAKRQADSASDISAEEARYNQAEANVKVFETELLPIVAALEAARLSLYEECAEYFPAGDNAKILSEAEEADLVPKHAALKEHEALTLSGEIIPEWRGTEYHLKTGGTWAKAKIEHINEELPEGAVLPDDLTADQRAEIAAQGEAERIAALDPEAKEAEKQAMLDSAADEADRLERRAKIQGKDFDTAAWYAEKRDEIEAKYA